MNKTEIKDKIFLCLEQIGILIDKNDNVINLQEYINDSIVFLMFVAEIEDTFKKEIPEDIMFYDQLYDLNNLVDVIDVILKEE